MHYFGKSLKKGQSGELRFHQQYPILTRLNGRSHDFTHPTLGTIELKSDFYAPPKNFFIELRVASAKGDKPGGPFQALNNGTDWFVYQFMATKEQYWFNTKELCAWLELFKDKFPQRAVHNPGCVGFGLLIPINVLQSVAYANPIDSTTQS